MDLNIGSKPINITPNPVSPSAISKIVTIKRNIIKPLTLKTHIHFSEYSVEWAKLETISKIKPSYSDHIA